MKNQVSKQDFIHTVVMNTIAEYLAPYRCDPAQIKKAHARCIHDAQMLADEVWGTAEEPFENLVSGPTTLARRR
jgi:hypothetical protein